MKQFRFGRNWRSFSKSALDESKILQAKKAFTDLLHGVELKDKTFLDIGFGQGLALFFAQEAGAVVFGIDIDADNLEAVKATKRFFPDQDMPQTEIVSILDDNFVEKQVKSVGYDIIHSWGVLHHTGNMKKAILNAMKLVRPGGVLVIAIYNTHWSSPLWKIIKWTFNHVPAFFQTFMISLFFPIIYLAKWLVTGENPKKKERGMDFYHDLVDWIGGYPYEYATIKEIVKLAEDHGFTTIKTQPAQVPTGCNEFVFIEMQLSTRQNPYLIRFSRES